MSISSNIKKLREGKGYSQEYMAIQLDIGQTCYCKMEKNTHLINVEMLQNKNVV